MGMLVLSLFVFSGCGPEKYKMPEYEKSPQGVVLEDFMPENVMMSFSINTRDPNQKEKFNNLKSYFPKEDMDTLVKSLLDDLNIKLKENDLNYEDDIAPLLSDSFKGIMAMTGPFPQLKSNKKNTSDKEVKPDVYVAFTVADTKKAEELMNKLAENDADTEKNDVFGYPALNNEKEDMYIVLYKDVVLMTNSTKTRYEAVKRARNNENSLVSNENFKKALESLPKPNMGMAYINVEQLFKAIAESEKDTSDFDMTSVPFVKALQYEAFALIAEDEGIKMNIQVSFDPKNKDFNIDQFPYAEPYLYKKLPGKDLMIYAESYGLKALIDLELKMILTQKGDKEDFEDMKKTIKKSVGLDFDNDILSWMDKSYVFVLQRNEGLMPGLSLYIDASSDPEGAKKTAEVINAGFTQLHDVVLNQGDPMLEKIVKLEPVKMQNTDDELTRFSIDLTQLTDEEKLEAGMSEGLFNAPMEVYYGVTKDNLFVFSIYTGLDKELGSENTVAANEKIKESMTYLKDYPYQLSYVSIDEVVLYVDKFIELMTVIQGEMPKDVAEGYAKAKQYLAPIKYLVGGNKKVENIAEGMMFIKMEKPAVKEEAPAK